mgnify:CR=1 FL=1
MVKSGAIEIIFKSHVPFQRYELSMPANSVKNASCSEDLCHRCLKQYAKLYKGEIESISKYCPLDLFSGDEMRMKNAIFDLFERPHNRFKVFKNGRILYTESAGDPNILQQEQDILNEKIFMIFVFQYKS